MAVVSITGNDAVGTAMKQINPDVVAAFPITPQTELMHKFAEFHANGEVDTELVLVESEHSAMSAVIGAAAAGARSMTATCSAGMALMWETLYIAASLRLPIVMPLVNRALSGPINIHNDHSDSMGARDAGWIQLFSENSQEAYDQTILAPRIAEHADVQLPVMVTFDGFIISHTMELVDLLEDAQVREFVGPYRPAESLLNLERPVTFGPLDLQDYYMEHKRQQHEGTVQAHRVIPEVFDAFAALTGRRYRIFEEYETEDADIVLVVLGSTAGTARHTLRELRREGKKVGVLKLRLFRPFPVADIVQALRGVKKVGVLDRNLTFGQCGVFAEEIKAALYDSDVRVPLFDFVLGLGGRDVTPATIRQVAEHVLTHEAPTERIIWIGVKP